MGQFDFRLRVDFSDYKLAETSVRIKLPVTPGGSPR
jgi:hypothetical protein